MKKLLLLALILLPFPVLAAKAPITKAVPFTVQAPLREWSDSRFQDACEEASVIMAIKWAKGGKITNDTAGKKAIHNEIIKLAAYQQKNYKNYHDTSAQDTADRLLKGYYGYTKWEVKKDITIKDIINALEEGNIVIAPTNGRLLKNPYFTAPGPERHMLVIKGYNYETKRFITNDPGTRRGESYQYPEKTLYAAIVDYPTGYHEKLLETKKNIIIVKK